jgi:hypothetical protein
MRSTKMTSALGAVAALAVLAPAGAVAAHPHVGKRSHPGNCHVSMYAEPRQVTDGETAQLFGQFVCPSGATTSGQTVTVYEHSVGSPGFQVLGTPATGAGGFYSILAPALTRDANFYARVAGARSATKPIKVAPLVVLNGPTENTQLLTGKHNVVTFTGTVTPADQGATVVLQREQKTSSEEWHAIQFGTVGAGGVFTIVHKFVIPGDANIRVVVRRQNRATTRGISNTRSYVISQAQNPNLTLESSQDPIPFGQTITLSGAIKAGANQQLTLLARKRTPGSTFTPVATTTSGSEGKYSFGQAPQENTSYRVTGAGISSAVLFEGVKYVLTAAASAGTVQSGQAVTFSGTVAPIRAGHVVYIERENQFGGGFHVVDAGTVGEDGKYSIAHTAFGQGKQVFRVKVPGDPANQAVSSATFSVTVTPAPGQALRPVPPAKLPGEGQV